MTHNYHTHTYLCGHAEGRPRDYIENALRNRLQFLGFSDHAPYLFPEGHVSGLRMKPEETALYYTMIGELREESEEKTARHEAAPLEIRIGFEMEYYPACFEKTLEFMHRSSVVLPSGKTAGPEYLILGQHFTKSEYDGIYAGVIRDDEQQLKSYTENVINGIRRGCYSYVAHPDVARYTGPDRIYTAYVRELCEAAKDLDVPLEINLLGLTDGRYYPNDRFWEIAADVGAKAVIGCDAHRPANVGAPKEIAAGEAYAKKFGLTVVPTVRLRKPEI